MCMHTVNKNVLKTHYSEESPEEIEIMSAVSVPKNLMHIQYYSLNSPDSCCGCASQQQGSVVKKMSTHTTSYTNKIFSGDMQILSVSVPTKNAHG